MERSEFQAEQAEARLSLIEALEDEGATHEEAIAEANAAEARAYEALVASQLAAARAAYTAEEREEYAAYERLLYG